jgi:hypothetical protein
MLPAVPFHLPVPASEPVELFPSLRGLVADGERGDWAAVVAHLGELPDLDDFVVACSQVEGRIADHVLARVPVGDPSWGVAQAMRAARITEEGWKIRGDGWARTVTPPQWAAFREHLNRAEQILIDVTAREPRLGYAWLERMTTCQGLSLGAAEARRRYDRLSAHAPHTYIAGFRLMQQLLPKWSGSWEQVSAFAAELLRVTPAGSIGLLPVLVGHLERHSAAQTDAEAAAYLRDPAVVAEIHLVADRTVRHPAFQPGYRLYTAHDYFAMLFSLMGDHAAAAPHFRALRGRRTPFWEWYFGDAGAAYAGHRDRALARG